MSDDESSNTTALQKNVYSTEAIIEAVKEAKGMITVAAELVGCSPRTIHRRRKEEPEIQQAIDEQRNRIDDVTVLKLFEAIKAGEPWAIRLRIKQMEARKQLDRWEDQGMEEEDVKRRLKETLTQQDFGEDS